MKKGLLLTLLGGVLGFGCASPEPPPPSGDFVLIQNGTLIDGTGAAPQAETDLLIRNDRIEKVGRNLEAPMGGTVIDATGKYLVPGLIDAHAHLDGTMVFQLSPEEKQEIVDHNPSAFLYSGVTTVLNLISKPERIFGMRQAQRDGELVAPRIYATGGVFTPEGGWGTRHRGGLASAEAAREQALDFVRQGTDGFKITIEDGLGRSGHSVEMPEDMLQAIAEVAHENDVSMFIHAINIEEYRRAVAVDPRAIVHGLEDPIPEGDPLIADLLEKKIFVVPTLSLWEAFVRMDGSFEDPVLHATVPQFLVANLQSPEYRAVEVEKFAAVVKIDAEEWARTRIPVFMENVAKMHEAGIKIAVGTDAGGPAGFALQGYNTPWELDLLVQCGLTPMEALVAATRNGADTIGVLDELGTLEPGKFADVLILDADPLENIRNVRKFEVLIQGGKVLQRSQFAYKPRKTS